MLEQNNESQFLYIEIEIGQEAGVHIPPMTGGRSDYGRRSSIAKSLPISMPTAMQQFRVTEDDFDEVQKLIFLKLLSFLDFFLSVLGT